MITLQLQFESEKRGVAELEAAVVVAGGPVALARQLGVTRETVRQWRTGVIPVARRWVPILEDVIEPYRQ